MRLSAVMAAVLVMAATFYIYPVLDIIADYSPSVTPPPGYWISIVTKSRRLWWTETVIYMEPDIEFNQPRKHAEMIRVTLKDFFFFHTRAESRIPM